MPRLQTVLYSSSTHTLIEKSLLRASYDFEHLKRRSSNKSEKGQCCSYNAVVNVQRASYNLCAVFIALYAPLAQPQNKNIPRFHSEVRTVLVDVLVLDEDGRPFADLNLGDFEVYEDGVSQKITHLDQVNWTSYISSLKYPAVVANSTNLFPRRFIFILNRPNASFGALNRAKSALEIFVVESMANGDEAMIIDIGINPTRIQEFRSSKEDTLQAIRSVAPITLRPFNVEQSSQTLYNTLKELGEELLNVRGRKVVLLMSTEIYAAGGPRTEEMTFELRGAVETLNQSNTSVYAINIAQGRYSSNGGLFPLSVQTGGRHFSHRQRYEPAVRQIGKENHRFYLLTYQPINNVLDGTYRKIEVRVVRPELEVIARNGYFARENFQSWSFEVPAKSQSSIKPPISVKGTALGDRKLKNIIIDRRPPLEVTTYLFPTCAENIDVAVIIDVPLNMLLEGPLTLRTSVLNNGALLTDEESIVNRDRRHRIEQFSLLPGSYLLKIQFLSSGEILQQSSTPIHLPTGFGTRFGFSSVALADSPEDAPSSDSEAPPLLRPTTSLMRGENPFLFFRLTPGTGSIRTDVARLSYRILQGQTQLYQEEHPHPLRLAGLGPAGLPVLLKILMSGYSPGLYRIELMATDERDGRRTFGEIELLIGQVES